MADIVEKDLPEFVSLLASLKTYIEDSTAHINSLHAKALSESRREEGLSFLETKCHLFLEYLIDVTYVMLLKVDGKSLLDQGSIERLVRTRTILEKIRPIDKKLKYQVDKLVKMASAHQGAIESHPLSFKPDLDDLVDKNDEDDIDEDPLVEEAVGVYIPPKVSAVPYDDDNISKKEKCLQQSKRKSLDKSLLADLRSEYGEEPEEIQNGRSGKRAKTLQKEDERVRYEEENMRRLTLTKKDKMQQRKLNDLHQIIKLGSYKGLEDDDDDSGDNRRYQPKSKKKKGKFFTHKKLKKRMHKHKK